MVGGGAHGVVEALLKVCDDYHLQKLSADV